MDRDSGSPQVQGVQLQVMDSVVSGEEVHPHDVFVLDRSQTELMHHRDTSQLDILASMAIHGGRGLSYLIFSMR